MIKIFHYRARCIGCNACVEINPQRWAISKKDGKAVLIGGKNKKEIYNLTINEVELEDAKKAQTICPVNVIKVEMYP